MAGSSEHGNEPLGNFLTNLGTKIFKDLVPWNESASQSAHCIRL